MMGQTTEATLRSNGRLIRYRIIRSRSARRLRLSVGPRGVEVVSPTVRLSDEIESFVKLHESWVSSQLKRIDRLRGIMRPQRHPAGCILFRGEPTTVRIEMDASHKGSNWVTYDDGCLTINTGTTLQVPATRTLENWLRKQARQEIEKHLAVVTARLKRLPRKVYIMGQRTKWGNCSRLRNLSFNWRLIMAPEYVLRYLVTHEAVHLAIPDHSRKFWLTVQSLCAETERAKQWLSTTGQRIQVDLNSVIQTGHGGQRAS
jgi:predicted metal-dependent hydrolase